MIIGAIKSINFGDPILTECVRRLVREKAPDAEVMLGDLDGGDPVPDIRAIAYPTVNERREQLPSVIRLKVRQWKYLCRTRISKSGLPDLSYRRQKGTLQRALPAIRDMLSWKPDLVIFAGGQILCDWYGLQVSAITRISQEKQIPVVFTSCGTGPSYSGHIRHDMAQALRLPVVHFISLRDGIDKIRRWELGKPLYDSADPALWTASLFEEELSAEYPPDQSDPSCLPDKYAGTHPCINSCCAASCAGQFKTVKQHSSPLPGHGRPVGIGVIYSMFTPINKELLFLKRLTSWLDRYDIPWKFFGNGSLEDMLIAEQALKVCVSSEKDRMSHMASWPGRPEDLIRLEAGFRGIISFRLHSHIIAASLGIPSIAIRWDDKQREFFTKIGASRRCLDISEAPGTIWTAFLQAEQEGYDQQKMNDCRQMVSDLLDMAIKGV